MKKTRLLALIVIPVVLIAAGIIFIFSLSKEERFSEIKNEFFPENLIKNGNFADGLNYWSFDKNVITTNIDNQIHVFISNDSTKQKRIWQDINVISGQTYQLTFELYGQQQGAFAIYRDTKTRREKYFWCKGESDKKTHVWTFSPNRTGEYSIYLSTNKPGKYYFANINLKPYSVKIKACCKKLLIKLLIALIVILVLLSLFYNKIFIIVILLLLLFPIIEISDEKISKEENRNLSGFKSLIITDNGERRINTEFGKNFNDWLNDHFWNRKLIISQNTKIKNLIDRRHENELAFQGDNGWLFNKHNYYEIS